MDERHGIPERESESIEFKLSMSEIDTAVKSGSAMLNSTSGGVVYIGIRDDGELVGIDIGDRTHDKIASALTKLAPDYWPDINTIELASSKSILSFRFSGNSGLYRFNGRPFIRIGASNHELPEEQFQRRVLEQFHASDRWELKESGLSVGDLDNQLLGQVVESAISNGRLIDPGSRDPLLLLNGLGLTTNGQPNNAAVVLFGKPESLQQTFPQCSLRMARFEGMTKNTFRDNRQRIGNIFDLLRAATSFVADHNPIQSKVVPGKIERTDSPLYNPEVIREALVNAFAHRDYAEPSGAVDLAIYDDRLEITSTGGLRFGLTIEDLTEIHQSRPWNPSIASVLQRQGSFESWGRGTTRMIELSRISGIPDPVYIDRRHSFTVRLSNSKIVISNATDNEERVIAMLAEYGTLGLSEMVEILAWQGTPRQLREVLNRLRDANRVDLVGSGRHAKWKLSSR